MADLSHLNQLEKLGSFRPIGDIQAIEFFPVQPLQKERL